MNKKVALGVVLALVICVLAGYWIASIQIAGLQAQMSSNELEISRLRAQLSDVQDTISDISEEITSINRMLRVGNQTPHMVEPVSTVDLYRKVKDSVVLIRAVARGGENQGSGFVYDKTGHIVTNYHVVEDAESIDVVFLDGSTFRASGDVRQDPYSDLAILLIDAPPMILKPLPLGDSSRLEVGTPVVAVGNPFGLSGTLTTGVVSQVGRSLREAVTGRYMIPNVIQIDAAINPGSSGGPLLNYKGEVIGITTAIFSETGAFAGVGFAIPSNTVRREAPLLIAEGRYEHPFVGIEGVGLTSDLAQAMNIETTKGLLIIRVSPGGPAEKAGLRGGTREIEVMGRVFLVGGDIIVKVDDVEVRDIDDLSAYLEENTTPGQKISVTILRQGQEKTLQLTLGVRPPPLD